jgi:hypothetical protein
LHPLKMRGAERARLAAKTSNFSRMGRSPVVHQGI